MVLRKATAATEAERRRLGTAGGAVAADRGDHTQGVHLVTETMRPSARGRRYKNSRNGVSVFDGPFTESKELIGGYVVVSAESLEDADRWARLYIDAVEGDEVDVRELE